MPTDCLFCRIASKEIKASIVYEDEKIAAFKDINPKAPVHILFIPKKHIETLNDISASDADVLVKILEKIKDIAQAQDVAKTGYRVVINCNKDAGQAVDHLHVHLLGGRLLSWPPG